MLYIINTSNLLKKRNIPIIAITKYGTNPLSKIADININHSSIGKGLKTYSTRSRTVQHNITDILFVASSQIRKDKLKAYYKLFNK
ncbi:MAG: SIS domain-containing protein [Firmicutes bacterium]|uniref:SIS domain-containing protein n=1 Tax=Candidatus Onthovivens merdipullorum TaxID=2840889 RepID=A0A9D9GW72_9BACL|nr:SIS domain-containing protein [Candidatus Onthovivens merdipullorum]